MRRPLTAALCVGAALLSACGQTGEAEVARAIQAVNVIDESNLNDIMLTSRDPEEAVAHFTRTLAQDPGRIDLMRGLGKSLVRAGRPGEAVPVWKEISGHPERTDDDLVALAGSLIRIGDWDGAKASLGRVPPTFETYERYRLEAMVADSEENWPRADQFYQTASGLTASPASVFNNWGFSKLTRGEPGEAERLFTRAVKANPDLFTAKNNLALARGAQRVYELPLVPMTQVERAKLLHTIALSAVKQGDVSTARALFKEAVATHPQHFEAAARALATLEET